MDIRRLKLDLDKNLTGVSNTEIAEYLIALTDAINAAVQNKQYSLMSILTGYKIKIELELEERLKKNLS
tara:strand:- start:271 stop:477 length:207 start_codon:yes stop_codon:yes gene_type:complete